MWPRSAKKSRNRRRISLLCMRPVRGQLADLPLMFQVLQFDPQVLQCAPEQAGDVHLAYAYVVCDLGLCLALVEAELQDLLLLALEALDRLLEQDPVLQPFYRGLIVGLKVHDRVPVRLVLAYWRVEAGRVVCPPEGQRLRNTLDVGVERLGELLERRRTARPDRLVAYCFLRRLAQLQQAAGTRFVRSAIAPAHQTSSTTVRQLVSEPPPAAGSSTSARTPSPAREKRKRVGASSA